MRASLLSFVVALAVFFTAVVAHAQATGYCVNRPVVGFEPAPVSLPLPRKPRGTVTKVARIVVAASVVVQTEPPGRSQMPTLCVDEHQPGCQIERTDSPEHQRLLLGDFDAGEVAALFAGIDTPPKVAPSAGGWYEGALCEGYRASPWRPPTA
jgi:hypothetical protein